MLPTIPIGSIVLPTYPLLLLFAFWVGTWIAARRATQFDIDSDHIYNASIYGLIAGLLGARFWYVITHWDSYAPDITQAFSLSRSALGVSEGVVMAGLAMLIYLQYHKLPLGYVADAAAPGVAFAAMIFHWGLFLGERQLGKPTPMPWGIDLAGEIRHPIHLYEALACVGILLILFAMRHVRPWPSFQWWLTILLYGATRLMLEGFHEMPPLIGDGFLLMQVVGLILMVVALAVMAYNFRKTEH